MPSFVEIEFKGSRKLVYSNPEEYPLCINDFVIVRAEKGEDGGKINRLFDSEPKDLDQKTMFDVLRKASCADIARFDENREKECGAKHRAREFVKKHELDMKLVSVEYQLDANKITFYFTADQRVDFRELVKDLAAEFKARIELRQIGVRDEARLIGGCGVCGMEYCCTSCVRKFEPISTQFAKDQMLSTNPSKLSGSCGRLRCCLRFEQGFYEEELKRYPSLESAIKTEKGEGRIEKIDVFREEVFVRFPDGSNEQLSREEAKQCCNKN